MLSVSQHERIPKQSLPFGDEALKGRVKFFHWIFDSRDKLQGRAGCRDAKIMNIILENNNYCSGLAEYS